MLSAYSYSKGAKFSEGQRKMLYVLGSRALSHRERAPVREPSRHQQGSQFRQRLAGRELPPDIIGFAHALEESDRYTAAIPSACRPMRVSSPWHAHAEAQIETIVKVGLLHDVARSHPQRSPQQAGKLTPEELAMFRFAPGQGQTYPRAIPFMRDIVPGCYCHTSLDGSGYPKACAPTEFRSSAASLLWPTPTMP